MRINGPHKSDCGDVLMIEMTPNEAIRTIQSLSEQILNRNPNVGRYEKHCDCGTDFSIAVIADEPA